jgi:hypothetical protein
MLPFLLITHLTSYGNYGTGFHIHEAPDVKLRGHLCTKHSVVPMDRIAPNHRRMSVFLGEQSAEPRTYIKSAIPGLVALPARRRRWLQ